jgi:hypothetical protein
MLRSLLIMVVTGLALGMAVSCGPSKSVQTLTKTTQETLELVKKEAQRAIALTLVRRSSKTSKRLKERSTPSLQ